MDVVVPYTQALLAPIPRVCRRFGEEELGSLNEPGDRIAGLGCLDLGI